MASLACTAVTVPSYTALNAGVSKVTNISSRARVVCSAAPIENNWSKVAKGLVATGASVLLAASAASAAEVKLGSDTGELIFVPNELTVSAGEQIIFKNNAGFPHNVVIDEAPDGVDVDALSHEDYLNAPGESFTLTLKDKGAYAVICEPHQGGGMKMTINVHQRAVWFGIDCSTDVRV
ncbi:hypothetical protein R1sor_014152 [Riccia sorocarpa]|uniref:Plastocyanin n=1 Tax=Riccia sorocarpa TaxID=122646 RepID=A0ABD3H8K7_9MARC